MTVLVLFFAGVRAIIIIIIITSSYSSLLQESDDRIYLSISKHSTSKQVDIKTVLYKQYKGNAHNIFSVNKPIAYPHPSLVGTL